MTNAKTPGIEYRRMAHQIVVARSYDGEDYSDSRAVRAWDDLGYSWMDGEWVHPIPRTQMQAIYRREILETAWGKALNR